MVALMTLSPWSSMTGIGVAVGVAVGIGIGVGVGTAVGVNTGVGTAVGVNTGVGTAMGVGAGVGVGVGTGVGVAVEPGGSDREGDSEPAAPVCVSLTTMDLLLTSIFTYPVSPTISKTGPIHSSTTQPG